MDTQRLGNGQPNEVLNDGSQQLVICHGSPVPPGHVVTGEGIDSSCPGGKTQTLLRVSLGVRSSDAQYGPALQWGIVQLQSSERLGLTVSLRDRMSPVQNQGRGPHCTAFAITACLEVYHGKIHLSESHLNHLVAERTTSCASSIALIDALYEVWRRSGIVTAADLPHRPDITCFNPLPNLVGRPTYKFENANIVMLNSEAEVLETMGRGSNGTETPKLLPRVDDVRRVLGTYQVAVALDVPIFMDASENYLCNWVEGPDISMPTAFEQASWLERTNSGQDGKGWHAIVICGYDDSAQRFLFKNSWGSWGDQGYGTIPYDYVAKFSRIAVAGWVGPPPY